MEYGIHSVIILNYNDFTSTEKLVDLISLYQSIDYIVIVDNCSTDDSAQRFLNKYSEYENICVMINTKNGGYSYGNDIGCWYAIEKLKSDFLTIANPDVYFTESFILKQLRAMHKLGDRVGCIGSIMNCYSNIDLPSAWKLPTYRDCILENLILLRRILGNKTRYFCFPSDKKTIEVDVIAGSLFTIGAKTFMNIGGFDKNTFLYYEENILAYKLKKAGYVNYLITNQSYIHMHSMSIDKTFNSIKKRLDLAYASRMYYLKTYLNCGCLKLWFTTLTYYVGRTNYLILKRLIALLR